MISVLNNLNCLIFIGGVGALQVILLKIYNILLPEAEKHLWWNAEIFSRLEEQVYVYVNTKQTCILHFVLNFKHSCLLAEAEFCRFLTFLLLDESWQCSPEDPEIPPMMARTLDTLEEVQTLPLPLPWEQLERQEKQLNLLITICAGKQRA